MKLRFLSLVGAAAMAFMSSCGGNSEKAQSESTGGVVEETLSGQIKIDGSSTVYPITAGIAELYNEDFEEVDVLVGVSGTGGGFKKFCIGETDINDASRPIKEKEAVVAKENSISYEQFTVAYDGLAVVVNKENDFIDHLTVAELKKLWENKGEENVMKWSEIRDGFPEENVTLYGPGDASGTFDYFNEAIIGKEGTSRVDYNSSENDNILVKGIADDKFALGYFGLAYYEENKEKLKLVPVDGGNGPVAPSLETVMDKSYDPLSRPIFIYVNNTAVARKEVMSYLNFYFDNTQEVAEMVGYIPLTEEDLAAQKKLLAEFATKK